MRFMFRSWRAVSVLGAVFMFASCASTGEDAWVNLRPDPSGSGPTDQISGTIRYLDLEGGLYVIQDAEGTSYNPMNLPEAFRVEGMAVEAEARRRDDIASIGMVGPVVELLRIRRRPGGDASANTLAGTEWRLGDLAGAGVFEIEGPFLTIHVANLPQPLRFIGAEEANEA